MYQNFLLQLVHIQVILIQLLLPELTVHLLLVLVLLILEVVLQLACNITSAGSTTAQAQICHNAN